MSAAIRATTVLSGLAVTGAATSFAMRTPQSEFSNTALASAEHASPEPLASAAEFVKPKLPSNFVQFSIGQYKFSNARV